MWLIGRIFAFFRRQVYTKEHPTQVWRESIDPASAAGLQAGVLLPEMRRILQLALQPPASSQVRVRSVAAIQLPVLSLPYEAHVERAGPRAQEAPRPRGLRRRHPQLAATRRVDAGRVNPTTRHRGSPSQNKNRRRATVVLWGHPPSWHVSSPAEDPAWR